jgi:hypothetical protein
MTRRKEVTKHEFDAFLAAYPRGLEKDVLRICEPEQIQFNDFSLGDWPQSVVASYDAWGHTPDDIWGPEPGRWMVLIDAPQTAG